MFSEQPKELRDGNLSDFEFLDRTALKLVLGNLTHHDKHYLERRFAVRNQRERESWSILTETSISRKRMETERKVEP